MEGEAIELKPLHPGQLSVIRIRSAAAALILLAGAAAAETALRQRFDLPWGVLLLPMLPPLLYLGLLSPGRRFRAWAYGMNAEELQVRSGVLTQVHTVVPLDRIQHIDLSQGPLERGFGVSRLVLHTAGTLHSQVLIPGLGRETAERMRDEIRERIREEPA